MLQQARDVLREPMLMLLVTAGALYFFLAEPLDGVVLMSFVLVVIGISLYQEHKTEGALLALRDLASPRAVVVRDGVRQRIAARDVVAGDTVLLTEGDRVPADAVLVDAVNLTVDESALTGEAVPVRKSSACPTVDDAMGAPGGDDTPWVFSGTLVVKGRGVALVRHTGSATELGRIGADLQVMGPDRTPLQRELHRLVRIIAVAGVISALVVFVVFGATRGDWLKALLAAIGGAMAMLPEEIPVVLTVFLAVGAWRMSRRHVLTRRSAAIETLGAVSAICVDKTGTLTLNEMTVIALVVGGAFHPIVDGAPLPDELHDLVEYAVLASPLEPFDPVDRAFRQFGGRVLAGTEHLHQTWTLVREYPLSEELLALSHVWRSPDRADYVVAAKGAPEAIGDLCHFDSDGMADLDVHVTAAADRGLRVLAVARARFTPATTLPGAQHDFDFEFLGLIGVEDPIRPGAAAAVANCVRAGVRVVMITGDYVGTAASVAAKVGIDTSAGVITGPELAAMTDEELEGRVRDVHVFARMVPAQKLRLIRALKADGEVVGMTGDGVNDAPALRAADIGIAMGARGTDVARESADLVLVDDDFSSIVSGIRQGRGIYDNIRKAMAYIIAVHVPIFGMTLIPVFVPSWPLVLLPVQIAFLQLVIDPACSVVFESEPIDPTIMQRQPRAADAALLDRRGLAIAALQGVSVLFVVLAVYLWALWSGRPDDVVRSAAFLTLFVGNLVLILVNRSWRLSVRQSLRERANPTLKWILSGAVTLVVLLLTVPALRDVFDFGPIEPRDWLIAAGAGCTALTWFEVLKRRAPE